MKALWTWTFLIALAPPTVLAAGTPDGPYWAEIPIPAGFGGTIQALGTLVQFRTTSDVHLWSAITREWTVVPVSPSATVNVFNAYAIIEDGSVVHGYATRTGVVDTLVLTGPPLLHHGPNTSGWLSIAQLGADLYGFASFDGKWVHQPIASSTASVGISQVAGVVWDGIDAYGFSAYHGTFVPTPAPTVTQIQAAGDVAVANDAGTIRGFSAQRGAWAVTSFPSADTGLVDRGYALFTNGPNVLAFSGYTATFSAYTAGSSSYSLFTDRNVFAIVEGSVVTGYASGVGAFASQTFNAPIALLEDDLFAVVESDGVTVFSGLFATFSTKLTGTFVVSTNEAMVWAETMGTSYAYSLEKDVWSPAPIPFTGSTTAAVVRNAVVLIDPSGYAGFSGRTATWSSAASTSPFTYDAKPQGDVFVGIEGSTLHMFDPVLARWASFTGAQPPSLDTWRQAVVATDGASAFGFGLMNNVWDEIPLQGNLVQLDANSSSGYVVTDTHVYAYSAHGSFSTLSRWPEFTRFQPKGVDLRLLQRAPVGSSVVTFVGTGPGYVPAGDLGTLFLDPSALFVFPFGTVPAGGLLDVAVPIPDLPVLNGYEARLQNGVMTPGGSQWLTSAVSPVFF